MKVAKKADMTICEEACKMFCNKHLTSHEEYAVPVTDGAYLHNSAVSALDDQIRRAKDILLLKKAINSLLYSLELSDVSWQWWCLELPQSGSCRESDSLIMLSPSLRSNLISRDKEMQVLGKYNVASFSEIDSRRFSGTSIVSEASNELLGEWINSPVFAPPSCWKFEEDFNRLVLKATRLTWPNEEWLRRLWLSEKLCCYGGLKRLIDAMSHLNPIAIRSVMKVKLAMRI
ncbi:hypothetical protein F2Q69_00047921 [Brassica cretica]|uniref:Uncharacterized protein n=1 Tax=Brassica cretica TaxID=69181 RepID=A0A8S9PG91_BRACR|nr:hypothetical protein F2Q69_00047921 [Brassica cretica]